MGGNGGTREVPVLSGAGVQKEWAGASQPFTLLPHSVEGPVPGFSSWSDAGSVQPLWRQREAWCAPCQDGSPSTRDALETRPSCSHSAFVGRQHRGTKCPSWPLYRLIQTNPLRGYPNELATTGLDGLLAGCSWKQNEISPYSSVSKHQIQFPAIKLYFPPFLTIISVADPLIWTTVLFDKLQNLILYF